MQIDYDQIREYFDEKLELHKDGSKAVDWNSEEAQEIRFQQIAKVLPVNRDESFSVCDFGCGLGAFSDYVEHEYHQFEYTGIDVSPKMIESASENHKHKNREFLCAHEIKNEYDYVVESGIFNAREDVPDEQWLSYIIETLNMFHAHARKGFSFNCLTKYSDPERMKDYLYYADPCYLFDYCKKHYSRNVALLHDYDIYDFTILVKK